MKTSRNPVCSTFGCKNVLLTGGGDILPDSGSWYCDSFGLKPGHYSARLAETFVNLSTYGDYQSVPFQIQDKSSNICSLYSMFFAEKFCSRPAGKVSLIDFVNKHFKSADTVENDNLVLSYYQTKLRVPKRKLNCIGGNQCASLDKFLKVPRDLSLE